MRPFTRDRLGLKRPTKEGGMSPKLKKALEWEFGGEIPRSLSYRQVGDTVIFLDEDAQRLSVLRVMEIGGKLEVSKEAEADIGDVESLLNAIVELVRR